MMLLWTVALATLAAPPTFGNRTRLLINHIPKCGGSTLKALFTPRGQAKANQISGRGAESFRETLVAHSAVTIRPEWAPSFLEDRQRHFVIASLRDPCSYHVSLFSFGMQRLGNFGRHLERIDPSLFSSRDSSDMDAFQRFLQLSSGCLTMRVWESLPTMDVDCWVRTHALYQDLRGCLVAFREQGGKLLKGWDAHLHRLQQQAERVNTSPHLACQAYYRDANRLRLIQRHEKSLCELLGGCHCCKDLNQGVLGPRVQARQIQPVVPLAFLSGLLRNACFPEWPLRWRARRAEVQRSRSSVDDAAMIDDLMVLNSNQFKLKGLTKLNLKAQQAAGLVGQLVRS